MSSPHLRDERAPIKGPSKNAKSHAKQRWHGLGKVAAIAATALGAAASAIAIYSFVRPSSLPSFNGNLANHDTAKSFASFFGQNLTQRVNLDAICDAPTADAACYLDLKNSDKSAVFMILSGDPLHSASACWNRSITCRDLTVIMLVDGAPSASGSWDDPGGSGTAEIMGHWRVQAIGEGIASPPGVPACELTPTN